MESSETENIVLLNDQKLRGETFKLLSLPYFSLKSSQIGINGIGSKNLFSSTKMIDENGINKKLLKFEFKDSLFFKKFQNKKQNKSIDNKKIVNEDEEKNEEILVNSENFENEKKYSIYIHNFFSENFDFEKNANKHGLKPMQNSFFISIIHEIFARLFEIVV